jgi:T-complex protein 1 subunit eta
VSGEKEFFADMVVTAVTRLDPATLDLKMIGMKKVGGGHQGEGGVVTGSRRFGTPKAYRSIS